MTISKLIRLSEKEKKNRQVRETYKVALRVTSYVAAAFLIIFTLLYLLNASIGFAASAISQVENLKSSTMIASTSAPSIALPKKSPDEILQKNIAETTNDIQIYLAQGNHSTFTLGRAVNRLCDLARAGSIEDKMIAAAWVDHVFYVTQNHRFNRATNVCI